MTFTDFTFSRAQRMGILTLIALNLCSILTYFLMPYWIGEDDKPNDKQMQQVLSQLILDTLSGFPLHPFHFDPNTLDEKGFIQLGLSEKVAHTIVNYREKGGRFRDAASFRKIWGIKEEEYRALLPFIQLPYEKRQSLSIELNTCDTTALKTLPAIGSTLAKNIVEYRRLLGGFVAKEQIKEAWGIREETYQCILPYLRLKPVALHKININTATLSELKEHPYLRGDVALQIVNYRKSVDYQIKDIEELKSSSIINAELFRKIAPYISIR
jgi:competence protein ComEA